MKFVIPCAQVDCTATDVDQVFATMDIIVQEVKSSVHLKSSGQPFKRFEVTAYPERKAGYLSARIETMGVRKLVCRDHYWKITNG